MSPLAPRGERLLPVLTGVLLVTAFPPFRLLLPSFIALVPLLVFVAERPPGSAGRWAAGCFSAQWGVPAGWDWSGSGWVWRWIVAFEARR